MHATTYEHNMLWLSQTSIHDPSWSEVPTCGYAGVSWLKYASIHIYQCLLVRTTSFLGLYFVGKNGTNPHETSTATRCDKMPFSDLDTTVICFLQNFRRILHLPLSHITGSGVPRNESSSTTKQQNLVGAWPYHSGYWFIVPHHQSRNACLFTALACHAHTPIGPNAHWSCTCFTGAVKHTTNASTLHQILKGVAPVGSFAFSVLFVGFSM